MFPYVSSKRGATSKTDSHTKLDTEAKKGKAKVHCLAHVSVPLENLMMGYGKGSQ